MQIRVISFVCKNKRLVVLNMKRSLSFPLLLMLTISSSNILSNTIPGNQAAEAKSLKYATTSGITSSANMSGKTAATKAVGFAGLETKMEKGMVSAEETIDGKVFHIGKTIVNAAPEQVFAVLTDYPNSTKLFSNLKRASVVSSNAEDHTADVSFSLKGLANIWNFDYVLRMTETFPSRIDFRRVSGAFKANEGYWKIEPLDGSGRRTLVSYYKYIDGGMIPQSMVNKQLKEAMPAVMANVKAGAEAMVVQVSVK